jgi:hypothetical protein
MSAVFKKLNLGRPKEVTLSAAGKAKAGAAKKSATSGLKHSTRK